MKKGLHRQAVGGSGAIILLDFVLVNMEAAGEGRKTTVTAEFAASIRLANCWMPF
jgi:hypothetical protein